MFVFVRVTRHDPEGRPEVANLLTIYAATAGCSIEQVVAQHEVLQRKSLWLIACLVCSCIVAWTGIQHK